MSSKIIISKSNTWWILREFSSPHFIILKRNCPLRCRSASESGLGYSCNSAPPCPHIWKDCCSQSFCKPDSQLQKLLSTRSWRDLIRTEAAAAAASPSFSAFLPVSFSPFSALLRCHFYFFLFIVCERLPLILPHVNWYCQPRLCGSWNVSCHDWGCGWEGKAHDELNEGNRPAACLWEGPEPEVKEDHGEMEGPNCAPKVSTDYTYQIGFWILLFLNFLAIYLKGIKAAIKKKKKKPVLWMNPQSASAAWNHNLDSSALCASFYSSNDILVPTWSIQLCLDHTTVSLWTGTSLGAEGRSCPVCILSA